MPEGVINLSDLDSKVMRTQGTPPKQGYNAQAAVNDRQVLLAAEISVAAPDFGQLGPMLDTTLSQLADHGVTERPQVVLADAGYWHTAQMQAITEQGIEVLVPPDGNMREGKRPDWEDGVYQQMRDTLTSDRGRELYAQRKITIDALPQSLATKYLPSVPVAVRARPLFPAIAPERQRERRLARSR